MKIAVCVKQVPDTETRIRIAADGKGIVDSDVSWVVSPYDEIALEEALRIKEAKGGEVVLLSLGPDRVVTALRNGLAMGADSAIHLKDPLFDAADTAGTAKALAAALAVLGADLILMGQQGVGGDHSQMPGLLAETLDLPQVTVAVKVEVQDGKARVEREIEGGREVWETSLPAVISAQKGLNEPRYASLKGIMAAKKKPLEVKPVTLEAGGLEALDLALPPERKPGRILGEGADAVLALIQALRTEAKVL